MIPIFPSRRRFLEVALGAPLAGCGLAPLASIAAPTEPAKKAKNRFCAFIKFIQQLPYKELAETVAELGFDGIEATVRDGGQVLPERVEEEALAVARLPLHEDKREDLRHLPIVAIDPVDARESLASLRTRPDVTAGCIYTRFGKPFAVHEWILPRRLWTCYWLAHLLRGATQLLNK